MPVDSKIRNTYSSQFVPLPLEIFARANERDQKIQDEQVAATEATSDALWQIKGVAPEDQQKVNEIKAGFDQAASQMVHMNLTQKENQKSVKDLIKGTSRDKDLNHIMSVASQYQEWQENVAEAKKEGNYMLANDMGAASYANYTASGGYKSGGGIDSSVFKYEDSEPVRKQYFDDMAKLGADQMGKVGDTFYKFGFEGISEARIGKQAMASINSYMNTTAAAQDARMYNLAVRQGQIDPKKMSEGSYIMKGLLASGMEREGMSFSSGEAAARNDDVKTKKADAKEKKESTSLFDNLPGQESPATLFNGYKVEFDDNEQIKGKGRPWAEVWSKSNGVLDFLKTASTDTRLNDEEGARYANVIAGANLNKMTPAKYAAVYNKTSHMVVKDVLIGKELKENTEVLFNGGAGVWSSLNIRDNKTGEGNMNFIDAINKVADEKGFDVPDPNDKPEEFSEFINKKLGVSITGLATANEFSRKPIIFTVGGNEFVADMTYGGTRLPYDNKTVTGQKANEEARVSSNLDKLMKGQLVPGNHEGKDGVYFRNLNKLDEKTGQPIIDFKSK